MSKLWEALVVAEAELEEINAQHGELDALCYQCKSTEYDSRVGIIHKHDCIIFVIREWFADHRAPHVHTGDK